MCTLSVVITVFGNKYDDDDDDDDARDDKLKNLVNKKVSRTNMSRTLQITSDCIGLCAF